MSNQARNQLGTPGVAKSFLRGSQSFQTMSNSFQLHATNFSRGGEKVCREASPPFPLGYVPVSNSFKAVVPKVGGTSPLGAVRNSKGAVKQKWAIGGR